MSEVDGKRKLESDAENAENLPQKTAKTDSLPSYAMDDVGGDLCVRGLAWATTEASLRTYFSTFGEMTVCSVKKEPGGDRSRGFGFINFKDPAVAMRVLAASHTVDGRKVEVKPPKEKPAIESVRKVFVGMLPSTITEAALREHFGAFGTITDLFLPSPPRGYCFIAYDTSASCAAVLAHEEHIVSGAKLQVKLPTPKTPKTTLHVGGMGTGGGGMFGGFGGAGGMDFGHMMGNVSAMNNLGALAAAQMMGMGALGSGHPFAGAYGATGPAGGMGGTMAAQGGPAGLGGMGAGLGVMPGMGGMGALGALGGMGAGMPGVASSTQLLVHNLPYTATWQDLKDFFRPCGNVLRAEVLTDETGKSKGVGTVRFSNAQEATLAMLMAQNQQLKGRPIYVREDRRA